jgi:Ca2+:H+ antiporter
MTLAVAAIALPTMVINTSNFVDESAIMNLSIIVAGVLITVYGLTLLFSLKTHSYLYDIGLVNLEEEAAKGGSAETSAVGPDAEIKPDSPAASPTDRAWHSAKALSQDAAPLPNAAPLPIHPSTHPPIHPSTHPPTQKTWLWVAILAVATAGVAFESDLFVSVVDNVTQGFGLTPLFTGVVLLPFLGDVAGYVTAVRVAIKNNMDLTVSVAMGSSLLVALFVAPVLVLVGQWIDKPMDLNFNPFEVIAMAIAVTVVNLISLGGRSNWLDGTLLLATYIVLGVAFYYHPA